MSRYCLVDHASLVCNILVFHFTLVLGNILVFLGTHDIDKAPVLLLQEASLITYCISKACT